MGWLVDEWSILSEELIPVVSSGRGGAPLRAAVCGSARNAVALALALRTVPGGMGQFEVFLCRAPSYSDPVGFTAAEIRALGRPGSAAVLERDGRRWVPTRELLEKVVVGRPRGQVDLVLIGAPAGACWSEAVSRLRPGGHVFLQPGGAVDLLDPAQFRPLDLGGRLAQKALDAGVPALAVTEGPPGPTLAEIADRAELIESHYPLARALARRASRTGRDVADLEQVAFAALVRAAGHFDPARNAAFASFAATSISGELKRYFRDKTWGLRVPRSLKDVYLQVKAARDELSQQLGSSPTVAQIAENLAITEEMVLSAMEAADNYRPASLDAPRANEDGTGTDVPVIDEHFDRRLELQVLAQALPTLDPSQRLMIKRLFFEGRTQREVAAELGVSQMQISRRLARALVALRQALGVLGP